MHALTVCAVIKDEARHLAEWLAFHRAAGVDHFLLYDNESTDGTPAILDAFERAFPGSVTVIAWPHRPAQRSAYADAYPRLAKLTRWAAFIDADEYLFGVEEDLKTILADFDDVSCLCAYWMIYGSSGHVEAPEGLCIEAFTRRARADSKTNGHFKPIARAAMIRGYLSAHRPRVQGLTVDEQRREIGPAERGRTAVWSHERIRINHYIVKSRAEWALKQARGSPVEDDAPDRFRPDSYFTDYDRNEREDSAALRFLPQVRAALAALSPARGEPR